MIALGRLPADRRAAAAAEFALVLPLLLLLLFAIIDGGRLLYVVNEAEKATQMGARYAVVTDVMPTQLINADYTGTGNCGSSPFTTTCATGDPITNRAALGALYCKSTGCTCAASPCPSGAAISASAFNRLVTRMQSFWPSITSSNVRIIYRGSGVGYAGDPTGMDVVPLVTVELRNVGFRPLTSLTLAYITLPAFSTTLSAESVVGIQSN